ncbi:Uncharacterized protein PHPALM_30953 [Phytophthora palmivora]|uniref:Retrotransposon gag domain-containing protein n=1 Tax=Phytophthora palmivora TaxID=4796 RepID=A0A2P4X3V2_9STRA|nr:Uncharacterized protein PHPALM_30953 [Phytophthora palmivora]
MLHTLPPTELHGVALGFIMREQRDAVASKPVSPSVTPRAEHFKLHVSSYMGREDETLLRWLVELDIAITTRRVVDPFTYEAFKGELKLAFEPPQNGFRSRAEFLDLQQVTNPIDEATKVVTFMKGLKDSPVKTYLFREYPSTLEAAITLAMQEEYSLRQTKQQ